MAKFLDLTGLGTFLTDVKTWAEGLFLKKTEYTAPNIQIVKVNGSQLTPDGSKAVNIDLSDYALSSAVTQEIAQAVSGITSFEAQVVESLPGTGTKGILYLVANSGSGQNVYDEYLWLTDKYEKLGTREIDLSGYALKTEIPTSVSELENDAGYLTTVPSEYVTDTELTGKGYQTSAQVESAITSKGYQTASQVNSIVDGKGFLTAVPEEYVTDDELTAKGYQTSAQVESAITGKGYQTSGQVQTAISEATADFITDADLPTAITEEEIDALFS